MESRDPVAPTYVQWVRRLGCFYTLQFPLTQGRYKGVKWQPLILAPSGSWVIQKDSLLAGLLI